MPNLQHDPQNPTDLLGRPIEAGDIVAWGTTHGRSAALAVCEIVKIRFTRKAPPGNWRVVNEECARHQATDYQLQLRPIKTTGSTTFVSKRTGDRRYGSLLPNDDPEDFEGKPVTVKLVKNVVKLEAI